jgi:phospholipid/cholesterol/gamma-HCH transport system ATP-binding protein
MEHKKKNIILEIKMLSKSFGDRVILNKINLALYEGENLVILGKSGSGKSVLIKCLVGLIQPEEGQIYLFEKEITQLTYAELNAQRLRIGFLFQGAALYDSMTVGENLSFALKYHYPNQRNKEVSEAVNLALESVGLADCLNKMPSDLSGGMRKRIGLARTVIMKPEIIMYDEPTTGLDSITAREISELILSLQKTHKTSSIIITHDMNCAKTTADRIVMLIDGNIAAEGSYDDLALSKNESVKAFF